MDDKDLYHLIVNPYKVNKDKLKKISSIDNTLLSLLKKKYSKYKLEDKDYNIIINNLDKLVLDLDIKNLIDNFVDNIVEDVINII
jgi:hypothetical protein